MGAVSYALAFLGLVALVQGVAWSAVPAERRMHPRTRVGMLLAPLGLLAFALGLVGAMVPGFWG